MTIALSVLIKSSLEVVLQGIDRAMTLIIDWMFCWSTGLLKRLHDGHSRHASVCAHVRSVHCIISSGTGM
jgi:hypothetical protein